MATLINLNNITPVAPANGQNILWQSDASSPTNVSAYIALGGVSTNVQSNQSGSLYGDSGFTYAIATQSLGGAYGLFVIPATGTGTFSVAVAQVGTAGAVTYNYEVVARKGIAEISIGLGVTTTGNATLTSGNYNSLTWAAVPGATSYDVYVYGNSAATTPNQFGFLANIASLFYHDIGTAPALSQVGPPSFPENGFLNVSNGLNVQNSNYQTLQSHFGDPIGQYDFYLSQGADNLPPLARNEFVTAGPGRLVDTVGMSVVSVLASNGPNQALYVQNTIRAGNSTRGGALGLDTNMLVLNVTDNFSSYESTNAYVLAQDCNLTGGSIDFDHGAIVAAYATAEATSFASACHVDAVVAMVGEALVGAGFGFTTSVIDAIGVFGTLSTGGDLVAGTNTTVTNGYSFKSGPINATSNSPITITNYYNYFASVPNPNFDTNFVITNGFGFYAKNQTPRNNTPTLQSAFYAEDQGNNTGAWAYFSAGTTPSKFGGPLQIGGLALPIVTKTISYATLITDYTVLVNAAGATTITLLTTGVPVGKIFQVKNINTGTVTVVGQTGNIDGAANFSIPTQYASATFQWDGSNWFVS